MRSNFILGALGPLTLLTLGICAVACQPQQPTQTATGYVDPNAPQGYGQPAYGQPGYGQPAYGQPGYTQPTATQPGYPQPTTGYQQPPATGYQAPPATQPAATTPAPAAGGFPFPGGLPFPIPGMGGGQQPAGGATPSGPPVGGGGGAMLQPLLLPLQQQYAPGANPEGQSISGIIQQGTPLQTPVNIQPGRCYTGIAVASPPVGDLLLELVATPPSPFPQVGLTQGTGGSQTVMNGAPNCFRSSSPVAVQGIFRVTSRNGSGPLLAQLYSK